jgi:hypothetical protein
VLRENLSLVRGQLRLVTLTAPGADALPWDEDVCAWRGEHRHRGDIGCRVDAAAANRWSHDLAVRYHRLCNAAKRRAGVSEPVVLARAWELQQRGIAHVHKAVIVNAAGNRYVEALTELAPAYGFGQQLHRGYSSRGHGAAAYLAKYVAKHRARGERAALLTLHEAALLPRQAVWVSPILTKRSGATMAVARLVRSLWALGEGFRETVPRFRDGVQEAWCYYWRRVGLRGRENVPRSVVPRDYGVYEPWDAASAPTAVFETLAA